MESILKDSGLETLNTILQCKTTCANEVLNNILIQQTHFPNINKLLHNQKTIDNFKTVSKDSLDTLFDQCASIEKQCGFFFEEKSLHSLEKDTFGQLIFQNEYFNHLNAVPYLLLIISFIKIYFVPILSVLSPIVMYFIPYLIVNYVWNIPISYTMYQSIMGKFWSFDLSTNPQKIIQNLFTLFTIGQSMYQPIQNAFHLYTINTTIVELGSKIVEYFKLVKSLQDYMHVSIVKLPSIEINDIRRNFFYFLENPNYLKHIFERVSYYEILYRVSQCSDFSKVTIYQSKTPYFEAKSIYDIHLHKSSRTGSPFSIKEKANHYLVSGPNGGGKSSFLRAVLQTILLSQTFGYSCGTNVSMSPFDIIFSGLHIQDIPGNKSLFEKEICFARDVLYNNNPDYKCLVIFDEIFHSTNPPDSIKTSNKFLHKLWSYKHFASLISTHVFEILEQSPDTIHKICVDSTRENNVLKHTYKIQEGINKESSVEMIWNKEFNAVS